MWQAWEACRGTTARRACPCVMVSHDRKPQMTDGCDNQTRRWFAIACGLMLAMGAVAVLDGDLRWERIEQAKWVFAIAVIANLAIALWERSTEHVETGSGFIPILIAALAFGPTIAWLTALLSSLPYLRLGLEELLRKAATRGACGAISAWLFVVLDPHNGQVDEFLLTGFLVASVYQVLQLCGSSLLLFLAGGKSWRSTARTLAPHFLIGLLLFGPMAVAYAYLMTRAPEVVLVATFAVVASHQFLVTAQRSRNFERLLSTMSVEIPGALLTALDAADSYTAQHSAAVASYAYDLAVARGYDDKRARQVHAAALMHDLGKIGVPDAVLTAQRRLTDDEWALIRKHPELGANMVTRLPGFEVLAPGILYHHERVDGSGYPHGIAGDEIPEEAQMIAIADTYSAITTARSYRGARSPEYAMEELRKDAQTGKLNAELVELFIQHMSRQDHLYQTGQHTDLATEVAKVRGWLDVVEAQRKVNGHRE